MSSITPQEQEFDLLDLLRMARRRKWLIIIPTAIVTALAIIAVMRLENVYTALADLRIGAQQERIANMQAVLTEAAPDKQAVQSEIEVLLSKQLAERVIDKLRLMQDPEFNPTLRPPTAFAVYRDSIGRALGLRKEDSLAASDPEEQQRLEVVDEFRKRVNASQKADSWVVAVQVTAGDPVKAAQIVNALADAYIGDQLLAKFVATRRTSGWLTDRISDLRYKVAP